MHGSRTLAALFQLDHFNFCFLMNADRDVHLGLIPRYAAPRDFAGQLFTDGHPGEHNQLAKNIVPVQDREMFAEALLQKGPTAAGKSQVSYWGDGGR